MQNQDKPHTNQQISTVSKVSDEVSFQDIVREFRIWRNIIRKNLIKLLITGLVGGVIGFAYAYMDQPVYMAKTRFMLKNEGVGSLFGGQMTGLTSLLGGGQMGTPLERTSEVIASDRIVGRALLRITTVSDTPDLIINHFIRLSDIRKSWSRDTLLADVKFTMSDVNIEQLTLGQRKAYKIIKSIMTPEKGNGVVQKSFDKKSGVLTLACVHHNESFAIALSNVIYDELSAFFVEQMTYSASNNAEVMRQKLDSIKRELDIVRKSFATQSDQSLGLLLQQDKVDLKSMAVKEQMLNVMYAEAIKNYESFEFVNKAATPSLMLIDSPISPLIPFNKNKTIYTLLIGLIFVFIHSVGLRIFYSKSSS